MIYSQILIFFDAFDFCDHVVVHLKLAQVCILTQIWHLLQPVVA